MESSSKKNKIVWAVDPTQNPADEKNLIKEMKAWSRHLNCAIQPVSIFSNRTLNFPVELAFPWKERFKEVAQKSLDRYLKKANLAETLPPEKIFIASSSARKRASELAHYAHTKQKETVISPGAHHG